MTRFHTPPPFPKSDDPRPLSQHRSASKSQRVPSVALTPRRTRSHGLFTPLPPGPPKKGRRFTDRRPIKQKYRDTLDENEQLQEQIKILNNNQAKLKNLLEAAQADCHFARQHIAALQAEHNAKKEGKQKRNSTKAEWLTSEENKKKRAEEKVECEKKEAEEKVVKEKKEVETRERQGLRNQWAMSGRFTGLVVSGSLWPNPNHNSKRATLYGSSVPYTRQSTNQEDSLAISGLTTNGEIYNDKTYFIPLEGERSL